MAPYAGSKGVPNPDVSVMLAGIPLVIGGTSLLFGIKPKVGAAAIIGFLAGVSPIMHDFWHNQDPNERQTNMINFMKNAALAGGALALMGVEEPWEASVGRPGLGKKLKKAAREIAA